MMWKIHNYDKVMDAIKDPKKILRKLTMSLENEKPQGPMTDEGFSVPKDLLVAAFNKMRKSNASKLEMSFNECAKLMGYSVKIVITSPKHKPNLIERIARRFS